MTTYYHVIAAGAGDNSGDSWANAMATADFITSITGVIGSDNVYYLKGAQTYTLAAELIITADGTAVLPNACIGVLTGTTNEGVSVTFADWAVADADKPTIAATTNRTNFDNYWLVANIKVTCASSDGLRTDVGSIAYNCSSVNTGAATRSALENGDNDARWIGCNGSCPNGQAIDANSFDAIVNCYVYDSVTGIVGGGQDIRMVNNIIDTCTTGINISSNSTQFIMNNTLSNCTTGLSSSTSINCLIMNNIFHDCTDGAVWTTQTDNNFWLSNNFFGNADNEDLVSITQPFGDSNRTTEDPDFETDGSDFRLKSGSGCLNNGEPLRYGA